MNSKYVLVTENSISKPYRSYKQAKKMALAWIGQFSTFFRIDIVRDGKVIEVITPCGY